MRSTSARSPKSCRSSAIKQIPQAPPAVAGSLNYRGAPVPVIDLSQLTLGRPAARRLSTRIVLVHYPDAGGGTQSARADRRAGDADGPSRADGLRRLRRHQRRARRISGPVATDARGLLQWIDVRTLLPAVAPRHVVQRAEGRSMGLADFENLLKASMGLERRLHRLRRRSSARCRSGWRPATSTIRTPIWERVRGSDDRAAGAD